MKRIVKTASFLSLAAVIVFAWYTSNKQPRLCRVVFGTSSTNEILIGARNNELLIYRDGTTNSTPETYSMVDSKLAPGSKIPPFKYGSATFALTRCKEFIFDEPELGHRVMLHGTITDNNLVFKQYCDVSLRSPREQLEMTHFDGQLTVGIRTYDWQPIPIEFIIGGEPTKLQVTIGTFTPRRDAGLRWKPEQTGYRISMMVSAPLQQSNSHRQLLTVPSCNNMNFLNFAERRFSTA